MRLIELLHGLHIMFSLLYPSYLHCCLCIGVATDNLQTKVSKVETVSLLTHRDLIWYAELEK